MIYKSPLCPFCYDGIVVTDGFGNFFCNSCFRNLGIKKFDGCGRVYKKA